MIRLIVNADDFGYSKGVNHGIVDAFKYGIVNSTTMMMNMAGTDHAIELAKENADLPVGIHLVLTCGKPLLSDVPSLVDEKGNFKRLSVLQLEKDIDLDELEREWTAQIERFLASGLTPTHFDSHHHTHGIKEFYPVVQKLAERYGLSVRKSVLDEFAGIPSYTDEFVHDFYGETATKDFFLQLLNRNLDGKSVEVMCHPAYLDAEVMSGSSYNVERIKELDILTNTVLPEGIVLL
ncbi:chitin disaccharide deacetylase [Bacillus sp. FJAT-49736]|uniref:chitin disaccharide deacetylase n=1 Tax=Bacillus sp. FJAT-49736 TaxID=2833582 RepID=UPI001BC9466A|nr:chitin disaccharide deacetylase [Bacillus sp. FJAT-49736]MBS4174471.1 chitin disaccharide deacetylase [Bacillus sp. FJAT-49736]MBS4175828.1 chitin disaccharide deacetylase [Bacillus sp. FJAT-49736]